MTAGMHGPGLGITKSTFSHHLRILRVAGVLTKRIQGARGYTQLRKADLDRRFPGLMDSIIDADAGLAGAGLADASLAGGVA
jgi:DNA-binding transcriptional ArsR family regulator